MNNGQTLEVSTFKKIFLNLPIAFNKFIGNIKPSKILAPLKAPLTRKHIFSDKKKAKIQELAKRLVAKRFTKTKQSRPLTLFLVIIELI